MLKEPGKKVEQTLEGCLGAHPRQCEYSDHGDRALDHAGGKIEGLGQGDCNSFNGICVIARVKSISIPENISIHEI